MEIPRVDVHERSLEEMNDAIDRITMRPTPPDRPRPARFATVVVGYDGSPDSRRALEWASALARLHASEVIVASVAPPLASYSDGPIGMSTYWPAMVQEIERVEREMGATAEHGAAFLREAGIEAVGVVVTGSPATEISRVAHDRDADLVVVGAKGGGAVSRVLLGSVAEALTGRVQASLLVARQGPEVERILVATDGSPESDRAVTLALELASARHVDLVVQHVLPFAGDVSSVPPEGYLAGIIERMQLPKPPRVRYVLDVGQPAREIVRRAERDGCGLILLGARGTGRIRGALLGSVSHRVANTADASVLIVRGEEEPRAP